MSTVALCLEGDIVRADVITFATRLEYDDQLIHVGTDEDWEIFQIDGTSHYVAYQQCSSYGEV